MPTGNFGIIRPSDFDVADCEIFYSYAKSRYEKNTELKTLATSNLTRLLNPGDTSRALGGLYDLRLPTAEFNQIGIYNVYIRPKEIKTKIADCGVLAVNPGIRGIVIRLDDIAQEDRLKFENNQLVGYRVEYLNDNQNFNKKTPNLFRIITSNFRVEPVSENLNSASQKAIKYRLNDNSSLVFCTLSPSTEFSIKANAFPFIGNPNQEILLYNTFFDPTHIEVDMAEYDLNSLANGIFGSQLKNVDEGVRTYFDKDGNIVKQYLEYVIKDETTGNTLYEVKKQKTDIDFTEDINSIT